MHVSSSCPMNRSLNTLPCGRRDHDGAMATAKQQGAGAAAARLTPRIAVPFTSKWPTPLVIVVASVSGKVSWVEKDDAQIAKLTRASWSTSGLTPVRTRSVQTAALKRECISTSLSITTAICYHVTMLPRTHCFRAEQSLSALALLATVPSMPAARRWLRIPRASMDRARSRQGSARWPRCCGRAVLSQPPR